MSPKDEVGVETLRSSSLIWVALFAQTDPPEYLEWEALL